MPTPRRWRRYSIRWSPCFWCCQNRNWARRVGILKRPYVGTMPKVIETAKAATIAYNDKNWDRAKELFGADGIYDEKPTHRRLQGGELIIEVWKGWASAFPDSKATFLREFARWDTAIIEVVWKGTHTGALQMPSGAIAASNKSIELPACHVIEVEDGKVKSFTQYFDLLTLLTQIGAAKG